MTLKREIQMAEQNTMSFPLLYLFLKFIAYFLTFRAFASIEHEFIYD